MRPEATAVMQPNIPATRRMHDLLRQRTGIRLAEVRRLFD